VKPSERVPIGATGLLASQLALGTAPLGGLFTPVTDDDAAAAIDAAWDAGIRLFDTAPLYGMGRAEERLGRALRGRPRDEFVLSTKVGRLLREHPSAGDEIEAATRHLFPDSPARTPVFDYSRDGVRRSLEESLERLGLDRVDIVHIHDADNHEKQALDEAFPALAELRAEGMIGAIGAGMNQTAMLARFARRADFDVFLLAGRYTLLDQSALDELFPACLEEHVAIIAGGVFNSGILASPHDGATYDYAPAPPELLERARRLEATCARHGVPLAAAAMQFPLAHPAVVTVLVGVRSPDELEMDIELARHSIPAELWEGLRADGLLRPDAPTP
jgi:D-threo-aldose 1-dehydrogenase